MKHASSGCRKDWSGVGILRRAKSESEEAVDACVDDTHKERPGSSAAKEIPKKGSEGKNEAGIVGQGGTV